MLLGAASLFYNICVYCNTIQDEKLGDWSMEEQPLPTPGKDEVMPRVLADLKKRQEVGLERYGSTLQTFNGRDALRDAYEEALDLVQYLAQAIMERENKNDRYVALEQAAKDFVKKVDDGLAYSRDSYGKFKNALNMKG